MNYVVSVFQHRASKLSQFKRKHFNQSDTVLRATQQVQHIPAQASAIYAIAVFASRSAVFKPPMIGAVPGSPEYFADVRCNPACTTAYAVGSADYRYFH